MSRIKAFFTGKKSRLKLVVFILAVAVAVAFITNGVVNIGHKDPGYYKVEVTPQVNVATFDSGLTFMYYADGSSNDIKHKLNEASAAYSQALDRCYKLLDEDDEYENYVNIATLNHNLGKEYAVSDELYFALTDAYAKTLDNTGYSMFTGALHGEWRTILYLSEPRDFDPLINADTQIRLSDIARAANAPDAVALTIVDADKRIVRLDCSAEYVELLRSYENNDAYMSLNTLKDAYLLQLVSDSMRKAGFDDGYMYTESGISYTFDRSDMVYGIYGFTGSEVAEAAAVIAEPKSVFCQLQAFPAGNGSYAVEKDGITHFRHPWVDARTGECPDFIISAQLTSSSLTPVNAAYTALKMWFCKSDSELRSYCDGISGDVTSLTYARQSSPGTLCAYTSDNFASLHTPEDSPFTVETYHR